MNNKCVFPGNNRGISRCLLIPVIPLLITGCVYKPEGPYLPAKVVVVSNHVCLLTRPEGDEKIIRLDINEVGSENKRLLTHTFTPEQATVSRNHCISTQNYPFRSGYSYTALITVGSDVQHRLNIHPGTRNFEVRFQLTNYFGQLRATEF
ncbi:TPA: putative T6SS immunity periplasmic lipoprotein [Morganella morganii]|uniref:putative T6SS immunity periplasmic lipoprotein n=1 Tax=Morganella morganii TaxID=582 RepID=UPI000D59F21D|nr:putative T6SS immunity periplasmic lipoprotein [Morganella morganii]